MEIKYVSDITGSGKTEYAINQIVEKGTENFILVVPNKKIMFGNFGKNKN